MDKKMLDLTNPKHSYMFGFIQADGSLTSSTRNRGKLTIEVKKEDEYILKEFAKLIPVYSSISERKRDTNFKKDYKSCCLSVFNLSFRKELIKLGVPVGEKSKTITPPLVEFSEIDYFRGLIDTDGSLGLTSNDFPFVSLTTSSDFIAKSYIDFIYKQTGKKKNNNKNKRDNVYNIVVYKEDAQKITSVLYYDSCLALPRKLKKSIDVLKWTRPKNMKKVNYSRKIWTSEEDEFILNYTIEESMNHLNRTEKSIKARLWRLRNE